MWPFKLRLPKRTGFEYYLWEHHYWRNSITFDRVNKDGSIHGSGHLRRKPQVGDTLLCKMKDDTIGRYLFTSVKRCGDPPDMFFYDAKFLETAGGDLPQSSMSAWLDEQDNLWMNVARAYGDMCRGRR